MSIFISPEDQFFWDHEDRRYRLTIRDDTSPMDPRKDQDNLGIMACWHRRYSLGDDVTGGMDPDEFWKAKVEEMVPGKEILAALLGKSLSVWAEKDESWTESDNDGYVIHYADWRGKEEEFLCDGPDDAVRDALDEMSIQDYLKLLESRLAVLPLYLYDHSGITMSTSSFADRWDSGQVGCIFMTKEKAMEELADYVLDEAGEKVKVWRDLGDGRKSWSYQLKPLTDETWRARAEEILNAEVEEYDHFLRGETYGFELHSVALPVPEDMDEDDLEWEEEESCYGFLGDDLLENGIASEVGCGFSEALQSGAYATA